MFYVGISLATIVFACWQDVKPLPDDFKLFIGILYLIFYLIMKAFGGFEAKHWENKR